MRSICRLSPSALLPFPALFMIVGSVLAESSFPPGLKPDVPFHEHVHRDLFVRDGLPSNWINDIAQTRGGLVWIATDNGLVRFDGLRFSVIDRETTPQLPSNETRVLYESRDGSLWIGTTSGLARYRSGRPPTFEDVPGFQLTTVFAIQEDSSGALWVGTLHGTYIRTGELKFEIVSDAPTNVRAICEDREGTMWLGSNDGLFRRNGDAYERLVHEFLPERASVNDPLYMSRVNVIRMDTNGSLWIGANRALLHWKDGAFQREGRDRVAHYTDLRPGDYTFRVAARQGNEAWAEAEPVQFVVLPRWWETRLFQLSSLVGFLGLITLGVQLRTTRMRTANEMLRREIRERARAESEVRQRQDELARVSRAVSMGELTTSIAHEVKQPLFAIVSNAQTARRLLDADPPDINEVREALGDIASDGDRASRIIDHVRSLVQNTAPKVTVPDGCYTKA